MSLEQFTAKLFNVKAAEIQKSIPIEMEDGSILFKIMVKA